MKADDLVGYGYVAIEWPRRTFDILLFNFAMVGVLRAAISAEGSGTTNYRTRYVVTTSIKDRQAATTPPART